jgi:hypothetical protein
VAFGIVDVFMCFTEIQLEAKGWAALTEKQIAEIVNDSDFYVHIILKSSPSASSSSENNEVFQNHQIGWFGHYFIKESVILVFHRSLSILQHILHSEIAANWMSTWYILYPKILAYTVIAIQTNLCAEQQIEAELLKPSTKHWRREQWQPITIIDMKKFLPVYWRW